MDLKRAFKIGLHNYITPGDSVIIGLSGGPDSVCLLHLLNCVKKEMNLRLYSAHFNHMLRGAESDRDERFCEKISQELGISFMSAAQDIKKISAKRKCGIEKAARDGRYAFFLKCAQRTGAKKIALAHNQDDNAETVLMRLMQGSGSEGLSGIPATRKISGAEFGMRDSVQAILVRPMIGIQKKEILSWLKKENIGFVVDRTNRESVYLRNRIRNKLIPTIEKEYNPSFKSALTAVASILTAENNYISQNAQKARKKVVYNGHIIRAAYRILPQALRYRVMRTYLAGKLQGTRKMTFETIVAADEAAVNGYSCNLPEDRRMVCCGEYAAVEAVKKSGNKGVPVVTMRRIPDRTVNFSGYDFTFTRVTQKQGLDLKCNGSAYFNLARVKFPLTLRLKQPGDRFVPYGMSRPVKLKKFLNATGAPAIILADREKILWAGLCRIDDRVKVLDGTKTLLLVSAKRVF
ncbi:MAG: tRNA lysidine(34) synthetase TilS [Spirochaetia bacterium]|nr:tRNA lysidine(34) synthetase TilS [Spirochaetia bacterium]